MFEPSPAFADRRDAGRRLAAALGRFAEADPVVLALPRGGVPVAFEVAKALRAPLDLILVRKLGAPGNPEFGIGAVVDGDDPQTVLNDDMLGYVSLPPGYVEATVRHELAEIERRRHAYLGERKPVRLDDRTLLVVDDGIATGGTMRAVLRGLAKTRARRVVLAVPVAPPDALVALSDLADEVVCLVSPALFDSVGLWYGDFRQTSDQEVIALLEEARGWT